MKKLVVILICIPLVIFSLIVGALIINPIINDFRLRDFSRQLTVFPSPINTKLIETQILCGKLSGCGNGMDFLSCSLIKSDLEMSEISDYYEDIIFKPAHKLSSHKVIFRVEEAYGEAIDTDYIENSNMTFDTLKDVDDFKGYYFLILYDGGYSPDFDIRGN